MHKDWRKRGVSKENRAREVLENGRGKGKGRKGKEAERKGRAIHADCRKDKLTETRKVKIAKKT